MKKYRINPKYSLILKSNNQLLVVSSNNKIHYYEIDKSEKENVLLY